MSNNVDQELSALMDGEASELEVRRVLKRLPEEPELGEKWHRFHLASAAMRGEMRGVDAKFAKVDLTSRISAALAEEPALTSAPENSAPESEAVRGNWWQEAVVKPLASVAIAASVSAMVVFGWQTVNQAGVSPTASPAGLAQVSPVSNNAGYAQANVPARSYGQLGAVPVAQTQNGVQRSTLPQQEILRMPATQDLNLTQYLMSHTGNAASNTANGAMSYARIVTLKPVDTQ